MATYKIIEEENPADSKNPFRKAVLELGRFTASTVIQAQNKRMNKAQETDEFDDNGEEKISISLKLTGIKKGDKSFPKITAWSNSEIREVIEQSHTNPVTGETSIITTFSKEIVEFKMENILYIPKEYKKKLKASYTSAQLKTEFPNTEVFQVVNSSTGQSVDEADLLLMD